MEMNYMQAIQTNTAPRVVLLTGLQAKNKPTAKTIYPLQRIYCEPWAERQGWTVVREFVDA